MTALIVLGALCVALLVPLVAAAVRQRSLAVMAVRNIGRRRGEAALVIGGALLGTAIITSSFVVGDIIDDSIRDVARTQLGPVDVVVTPAEAGDLAAIDAAVTSAGLAEIEGTLQVTRASAALEAPASAAAEARALPSSALVELDPAEGRRLGSDEAITGLADAPGRLADDAVLLNERAADRLQVGAGDLIRVHAYGRSTELSVAEVLPEVGLAGYGDGIVAPGTFATLMSGATTPGAPPSAQLLVSLVGGLYDTTESSDDAVRDVRTAVDAIAGADVSGVKASLLSEAELQGDSFAELFTTIGAFSVLAGILLLVNLFVMLAEERKTELGMLRALGVSRRRLTRAFALEGALYAVVATVAGTILGIGIGWIVARTAGSIFGLADQGFSQRLVIDPTSLALGASTGLLISLVTIWITAIRIGRLNVIRAIRDLPEPRIEGVRRRTLVLGAVGVLVGAAVTVAGLQQQAALLLVAGVPVTAFSATPLLRRLLPERLARVLVATVVLGWGLAAFPLFPEVLGASELTVFVVQGVVLTAGAISLVATLDPVWVGVVDRLASRGRGLAARLGLAYPLARRFRTSMLLGMFSLVVFTMAFIAALSGTFGAQGEIFADDARGGFDLRVDANPANPPTADELLARDDVAAVAGLAAGSAQFTTDRVEVPRGWPITGFDADLVAGGAPALTARDDRYGSDEAVYRAVLDDSTLAIVPDFLLSEGGPTGERIAPGDTVAVIDPTTGAPRELTVAATLAEDLLWNGVLVSRTLTGELFGAHDVATRYYLTAADGVDVETLAADLDVALLANGGDAETFAGLVEVALRQQTSFFVLLQGFLGLGLLVGIAGLGVVMVRAVRERRQEIGMLRAMGARTGLVRATFLSEAGLIALQGVTIGGVLGLLTARQVLVSSDAFGDTAALSFTVPWVSLAVITLLPLAASLLATAWPASRAAAIRPSVALRIAD
jgi:putative ABC transport system permease protein